MNVTNVTLRKDIKRQYDSVIRNYQSSEFSSLQNSPSNEISLPIIRTHNKKNNKSLKVGELNLDDSDDEYYAEA